MSGGKHISARVTALLLVLALCWPMATTLAAAASAPSRPSCCMRMSHACHSQPDSGNKFQAVCRDCGWCHALPNAPAGLHPIKIAISTFSVQAALHVESESQPSLPPARLHASRAPPLSFFFATQAS